MLAGKSLAFLEECGRVQFCQAIDIRINPYADLGYQRASACFEAILVRNGVPFHLEKHVSRLFNSARRLMLYLHRDQDYIFEKASFIAYENREIFPEGILKIFVSAHTEDGLRASSHPHIVIIEYPFLGYPPSIYEEGVALGLLEYRRPFAEAKSTNAGYEVARLFLSDPANANLYDVLFCDQDMGVRLASECSRSNFFYIMNNKVFTAPRITITGQRQESRTLDGVTRSLVMRLLEDKAIAPCEECEIRITHLNRIEACFITSTTTGVLPVRSIGNYVFKTDHPVLRSLMAVFREYRESYFQSRLP